MPSKDINKQQIYDDFLEILLNLQDDIDLSLKIEKGYPTPEEAIDRIRKYTLPTLMRKCKKYKPKKG